MSRRGELLALEILRRGLTALEAKAAKAKQAADDCSDAPARFVALQREAIDVMRDTAMKPAQALKKMEEIKVKEARIRKTMNQDFVKLMDRQFEAACDAEDLRRHITSFEMGLRFRGVIDDDGKPA